MKYDLISREKDKLPSQYVLGNIWPDPYADVVTPSDHVRVPEVGLKSPGRSHPKFRVSAGLSDMG